MTRYLVATSLILIVLAMALSSANGASRAAQVEPTLHATTSYSEPVRQECVELVMNGGFETDEAWEIGVSPRRAQYTTEKSHSGLRSMLLGIKEPDDDIPSHSSVYQRIDTPPELYGFELSYAYQPSSMDTLPYDFQETLILDDSFRVITTVMHTLLEGEIWVDFVLDATGVITPGTTVYLYFNVANDGLDRKPTSMYLDDVSLLACLIPTPTVTPTPTNTPTPTVTGTPTPTPTATATPVASSYLPLIRKNWPVPVRAGLWQGVQSWDQKVITEFRVTEDRRLCDFRHNISSCWMWGFNLDGCTGIAADGSVNFNAEGMGHRGRFVSPTKLQGEWSFVTPRCVEQGFWGASYVEA